MRIIDFDVNIVNKKADIYALIDFKNKTTKFVTAGYAKEMVFTPELLFSLVKIVTLTGGELEYVDGVMSIRSSFAVSAEAVLTMLSVLDFDKNISA